MNPGVMREELLAHAVRAASAHGLKSLSIGEMAREFAIPKSRLFTMFASNAALQLAVLDHAAAMFAREVIAAVPEDMPAERRVSALFARWLDWSRSLRLKSGCPFVHASAEGEDLPDDVHRKLRETLDHWAGVLRTAIDDAKANGAMRRDLETDQFVFELYGLYLSHHFWHWSMKDPSARARTMKAFERLYRDALTAPGRLQQPPNAA